MQHTFSVLAQANGVTGPAASVSWTVATGTVATADPSGPPPAREFGYSVHIPWQSDQAAYVQLAASGGAKTVRDDFPWSTIEPQRGVWDWSYMDSLMKLTSQAGLDVLAMAGYAPSWASSNPTTDKAGPLNDADYAAYVAQIAARYGHGGSFWSQNPSLPYHPLIGIELWNEPNTSTFWLNPNATAYAAMVKAAYPAIKQADPAMTVIAGATAPCGSYGYVVATCINPVTFLEQMYAAGAGGYFDALSHHPYNFGQGWTANTMLALQTWSAWSQMADTTPSLRSLMVANGDSAKQIWATETGAPTYSGGVSEAEQANLATQETTLWKSFPWAGNFYWYDLRNDCTDSTNRECNFGSVRADNSLKPSYAALKSAYAG
ncbi:MAG: cellulase family glycosylhydrolase [Solirubrobacteraceae bacterium]